MKKGRGEPLLTSKSGVVNEHPEDDAERFIPRSDVFDARDLLTGDSHTAIAQAQAEGSDDPDLKQLR